MRPFLSDELQPIREPRVGCRSIGIAEVRGVNQAGREVTAILSAPTIDCYGEIVLPEAVMSRLERFKKNPALLANHVMSADDGSSGIIGKWIEIGIRKVPGIGKAVVGTCRFMEDDPLAESWWQRFRQGVAVAFSIGFIVHGFEMRDVEHEGRKKRIRVFTDIELLEVSAVSIPACDNAVVLAASMGAAGRGVPASLMDPDTDIDALVGGAGGVSGGVSGAGGGGMSGRRMNKQLSRSIGPLIQEEVRKALSVEYGSELHDLIVTTALEVAQARPAALAAHESKPTPQKSSRATHRVPSRSVDDLDDLLDGPTASTGKSGGPRDSSELAFADAYFDESLDASNGL